MTCGRYISMYEMSTDSNSLKLVKKKLNGFAVAIGLCALPHLTEKQGGGVGTWAQC